MAKARQRKDMHTFTKENPFIGYRAWQVHRHAGWESSPGGGICRLRSNYNGHIWLPVVQKSEHQHGFYAWSFKVRSHGYGPIHGAVNLWGCCLLYEKEGMCVFEYAYPRYFWYNKKNENTIRQLGKIYGVKVYPYPKLKKIL